MNKQVCPYCGATTSPYKVMLTPMMVRALLKFKQAVFAKGVNSVHLLKDMRGKPYELTRHEWNNFSRQRFLALAIKEQNNPGYWVLTRRGNAFLNGEMAVPRFTVILHNKIMERSAEMVYLKDIVGTTPYMETKEDIEYLDPPMIEGGLF